MEELCFLRLRVSKDNNRPIKHMEAAFAGIGEILKNTPIRIGFEMVVYQKFLNFLITVPLGVKDLVCGQLLSQYPQMEIEAVKDYAVVPSGFYAACTELFLERTDLYPIQTYPNIEIDPLAQIAGVFATFSEADSAWIQLLLQPIDKDSITFKTRMFLRRSFKRQLRSGASPELSAFLDEEQNQKASKLPFRTKIRLACLSKDKQKAKFQLQALASSFKLFEKQNLNRFKRRSIRTDEKFISEYKERSLSGRTYLLNTEEIASIYHFPEGAEIAYVAETKTKKIEPPVNLPREGTVPAAEISLIGETTFRNEKIRFGIKRGDRSRHSYVLGKTGMGKTKLLELMILEDMKNGKGVTVLDPHGDLAEELLKHVPYNRIQDTIYFNPGDGDYPIAFNPMENVSTYEYKQNVVAGFIGIFKKIFGWNWNERMEHVLRYTIFALLDYPNSSVLGIPKMLSDNLFRQEVIAKISDPLVKKFWTTEFSSWSDQFSNEAIVPVINKVGQFVASPLIRNVVGQAKSVINMSEIMNNEKILIANLSLGKLGEENSALMGSLLITKVWQGALERASIPERERKDFYLYVDEFQNFATEAFSHILSEARKYKLCLTIAHQFMGQLPEDVRATIFGNVGSIVSFRVGGEDAAVLEKEFSPEFSSKDLMNLDMREIVTKMTVDGQTALPFSAKSLDLPRVEDDYSSDVVKFSQTKWAKPRLEVEKVIEEFESKEYKGKAEGLEVKEEKNKFTEPIV